MPRTTDFKIRGKIFIPKVGKDVGKIQITTSDETVYTILDTYGGADANNHTIVATVTRSATEKLGSFQIIITNDNGRFFKKFVGGNIIQFFMDANDATTLIFRGKIDDVKYNLNEVWGFHINITGRDYPELIDKTITGIEDSLTADVSLARLLINNFNNITLVFWNGSSWSEATYTASTNSVSWSPSASTFPSTTVSLTYQYKPGWRTIVDICKRVGLECYMEYDTANTKWVLRTFIQETITNTTANIAYGVNLIEVSDYGIENSEIVNRAIIYGKPMGDVLLFKTENNINSQTDLWIKDRVFNDGSLTTMVDVQDKANLEITEGIKVEPLGSVTTLSINSIRPGNLIVTSVPYSTLEGSFRVKEFTHDFIDFTTTTVFTRANKSLKDLFLHKKNTEELVSALSNPNSMTNSYTIFFDEEPSIMTLDKAKIENTVLRIETGQITGIAESDTYSAESNIIECELRKNTNLEITKDTYEVSNDEKITWENYTANEGDTHTFDSIGKKLAIRLTLRRTAVADTSPAYEGVALLYK